jgi:hypothetical protein
MPIKNIVKTILGVKHAAIDKLSMEDDDPVIGVQPTRSFHHSMNCGKGKIFDCFYWKKVTKAIP